MAARDVSRPRLRVGGWCLDLLASEQHPGLTAFKERDLEKAEKRLDAFFREARDLEGNKRVVRHLDLDLNGVQIYSLPRALLGVRCLRRVLHGASLCTRQMRANVAVINGHPYSCPVLVKLDREGVDVGPVGAGDE